jgi:UDP-N-acetylmuramyl pentapeptide phosphotransferase/UDP-N-acetylglucosamine-1-phosphate transferase
VTPLPLSLVGSTLARGSLRVLSRRPPGGNAAWDRTNHRGATVSLLAGPAVVLAASVTSALGAPTRQLGAAALAVGLAAGAVGRYDDTRGAEEATAKGFRGHLRAAATGRLSGGAVKVLGIGAASVLAAGAVTRNPVQRLVAGGVIAGAANLINLLDLRPGRALKAYTLAATPLLSGPYGGLLSGPVGAASAMLPDDLGERVMLGDAGANGLGALLGLRLAAGASPRGRIALLAGLAALTAASEVVSFSKVIAATPGLRELDALGRRPAR